LSPDRQDACGTSPVKTRLTSVATAAVSVGKQCATVAETPQNETLLQCDDMSFGKSCIDGSLIASFYQTPFVRHVSHAERRAQLNLRQIEVFHAVYSVGSISGASRLLNVSQPSVSKVIRHAESRLGFPLFKLVKGRLMATQESHVLFREVDELHARIDTFQRTARNLKSSLAGSIRMGVLPSLALSITPEVVARFRRRLPEVAFDVSAIHHDRFRDALVSRECDFVIGHHLLPDPEFASIPLGLGHVGALFKRGLLPSSAAAISLRDLRRQDVIGLAPGVAIADLVSSDTGPDAVRPAIVVHSVYIAAGMARHGAGIALVDEFTARGFVDNELEFRPLDPPVTFELKALHLIEAPLSRLARSFLDLQRLVMRESIAKAPARLEDDETP
jgi:DNA-binding transcriptional LysR family regulator